MTLEYKKYHYANGNVSGECYCLDGKLHHPTLPARTDYNIDGSLLFQHYFIEGKYHREDGPAYIAYDKDGNITIQEYYKNNMMHRDNGPAYTSYSDGKVYREKYCVYDKIHREDGPAIIYYLNEPGQFWFCEVKSEILCYFYLNDVQYTDKDITDNWEAFCKMQIFR